MAVVLRIQDTGSVGIAVQAVSTSDTRFDVEDFSGTTFGDVLRRLSRKGHGLTFVTDKIFVGTKTARKKLLEVSRHQARECRIDMFARKDVEDLWCIDGFWTVIKGEGQGNNHTRTIPHTAELKPA
ncbi:hypothetical protein [Alicyclobacillus ferrooxydans]|uniref:Uncharacterized protein n=1 Tax=Alicyclobacillus ferrooxydans TaxID=471514 RepID=A0A0P9CJD6_9BACL|nr:hypothetical protein [Alicyclobacillus ferrooxydans]KPV38945.1 hypothetical protein AN477_23170 [Alicyclobacillus ferrooxydans]